MKSIPGLKKVFGVSPSPPEWLIEKTAFGLDEQHIQESLFTLGNGFIGSRGVFEELPEAAMPGTFIAGVYDKSGAQVEELVNLPNPIHFVVAAEGEKLDMRFMESLKHVRYLDMQKGLLVRQTLFRDAKNRKFLYQSLRFFSMSNPHVGCMKISVTLLNGKAELTALDILDDSVTNTGGLIYGSRRHVRLMDADTENDINYCAYRTHTSKIWIAYADYLTVEGRILQTVLHDRVHNFSLKAGRTVTFTKTFSICTSLQYRVPRLKEETLRILREAVSRGFERNVQEHMNEWRIRWEQVDIKIKGDKLCDRAVRFNIYHLLIACRQGSFSMSVGARALTGQGYRGHIFWDTEIFILPFYIHTDPAVARSMLLYRYHRLPAARNNARNRGYRGALFPWESAGKGDDVTPRYAKDTDGSIIRINTVDFEQHISADVAYGVYNYFRATDDVEFMLHHGAEIIFETARFWASRAVFAETRKRYEIPDVIGPDEFHVRVKNNVYTNVMAAWNLGYAGRLYFELTEKRPDLFEQLARRIKLRREEVTKWLEISGNLYIPISRKTGVIEQFEGYFRKKEVAIRNYNDHFMPEAPKHLSYADFNKTKLVKQADVLLLFYLLPERFSETEKLRAYRYYLGRTLHQSSLSHSSHALIAAERRDYCRAYAFFLFAAQVDLKNLHNNTDGGIHLASVGGVWQAVVFGFAGVELEKDKLKVDPRLPGSWGSLRFNICWKEAFLKFALSNTKVTVTYYPRGHNQDRLTLILFDKEYVLEPLKTMEARRGGKEKEMERIKDIMKKENLIYADENTTVRRIGRLLTEHNLNCIPIVNENTELEGIISEKDVLKAIEAENFSALKAKDILKRDVEFVKEDDHVEIAIRLFTERPYRVLPVLSGRVLVGTISRTEILSSCLGDFY